MSIDQISNIFSKVPRGLPGELFKYWKELTDVPEGAWFHKEALTVHVHGDSREVPLTAGDYCLFIKNTNYLPLSHVVFTWKLLDSRGNMIKSDLQSRKLGNRKPDREYRTSFSTTSPANLKIELQTKTLTDVANMGVCKVAIGIIQIKP